MSAHAHDGPRKGMILHGGTKLSDYFIFNTDHKVIGIQYFITSVFFFMIGGALAMLIRAELLTPNSDLGNYLGDGYEYNSLFTMHGSVMIFLWVIPILAAFANYLLPIQVGADDMAFPKLNATSYWTYFLGSVVMMAAFFVGRPAEQPLLWNIAVALVAIGTIMMLFGTFRVVGWMQMVGISLLSMGVFILWGPTAAAGNITILLTVLTVLMFVIGGRFGTERTSAYVLGCSLLILALCNLLGGASLGIPGAAAGGWTAYPPLSASQTANAPDGQTLWIIAVYILGMASQLGAINMIVTVARMRAPGLTMGRLPLFVWTVLAQSILVIGGTPVLGGTGLALLFERLYGMTFFTPADGGSALTYQHLFWFYSHPAVYIMVLPAMGLISEIFPILSKKPVFGYKAIAGSSMGITFFGFLVWGHHMFTSGMSPWLLMSFMLGSMAIGVPTGIKIFNWIATLWGGKITINSPMLFALGFLAMFVIGGVSGIMLAAVPFDLHVHDTYFVVAHFHYVLFGGTVFGVYGATYFWFPKVTGRMYNEPLGIIHWVLNFVGFNLAFLPMHWLGMMGMARRIGVYPEEFQYVNQLSSFGAFLLGIAAVPWLINLVWSAYRGKEAVGNPWGGLSLEWQTSSPPPIENFPEVPTVTHGPYDYGKGIKPPIVEELPAFQPIPAPAAD